MLGEDVGLLDGSTAELPLPFRLMDSAELLHNHTNEVSMLWSMGTF